MAKEKIEVSKIIIRIGDKETPLTVEQARDLKDCLTQIFGGEKIIERVIEHDLYHNHPYIWYSTANWEVKTYTNGDGTKPMSYNQIYSIDLKY